MGSLASCAAALVAPGKGILASGEGIQAASARLAAAGARTTRENRRWPPGMATPAPGRPGSAPWAAASR